LICLFEQCRQVSLDLNEDNKSNNTVQQKNANYTKNTIALERFVQTLWPLRYFCFYGVIEKKKQVGKSIDPLVLLAQRT